MADNQADRHTILEDMLAIVCGALLVSLGVVFYAQSTLALGGNSGMALLLQYATGWSFSLVFSIVNAPFYILAVLRMGWAFTLRTFIAVTLVAVIVRYMPEWIGFSYLSPLYAAVAGGILIGMGMLILFRHRTGLGGINILALWLQERYGMRAGIVQLVIDLFVLAFALMILPLDKVLLSVLGAVVVNIVLIVNHRPGRYAGYS